MNGQGKVIFELGGYGSRRYAVEYQEVGGYRWESDHSCLKKSSAVVRAEQLIRERGIARTRVIDMGTD